MKQPLTASRFARFNLPVLGSCLLMIAAVLAGGCKPKAAEPPSAEPASATAYFATPWQSECEFIVHAIVADLAEQMYYAVHHRLPDEKAFAVVVTRKPDSSQDEPVYALRIRLEAAQPELACDVGIKGAIWSPQVYQGVAQQLARALALNPGDPAGEGDDDLLGKLKDVMPETIEQENQRVSAALEKNFKDPVLHEEAAVLLGAFLLRDRSGDFFEIRSPLSRLTAHLILAGCLRGSGTAGINGRMAEAMMLTLVGVEAQAMERLNAIGTNHAAALPMVRALQARNTGDYRPLEALEERSRIENLAWYSARSLSVSTVLAWEMLNDWQKQSIDYVRITHDMSSSVEIGHQLLRASIPSELQEARIVYALSHEGSLSEGKLVAALNELPERCVTRTDGPPRVQVIGWGQWASFSQRHLCHAIRQNFRFMHYSWGVPEEARAFASECEESFNGLRLYPFVRRFNCTDVEAYHKSVDDSFKVTVATPHLVPAQCWNYLCYKVDFAPWYNPNPNPHINEWHSHNPPPGTVYDLDPRLNHPSLINRPDAVERFEQLLALAPYDRRLAHFLVERKYKNAPTYEQAVGLFQPVLPYSVNAMRTVANTVYQAEPERYEKLMLQAAALNPAGYYTLSSFAMERQNEDQAAKYLEQAIAVDPDNVRISNNARWRVQYYLKKGEIEKARAVADHGGEVYSAEGLEAKATFLEAMTNHAGAFQWYLKLEERYDNSGPLVAFCERYKNDTGDTRYDGELKKRFGNVFPNGKETVSLADFKGAPEDGVYIVGDSDLLRSAGMRSGNVIVALNGTRTHTYPQYMFVRGASPGPELQLIVWNGSGYLEVKASPPNRKFGVKLDNYRRQ
jgi:hypothetical protein